MKSKILISLLLAVLMLGTLASPALAGAPEKGDLQRISEPLPGGGKYSFQATHSNDLKVTVVIKVLAISSKCRTPLGSVNEAKAGSKVAKEGC